MKCDKILDGEIEATSVFDDNVYGPDKAFIDSR